ncbi:MAG TPA: GTPase [Coleofasciculaceae cyanobacterium]|jgi:hypothetical protein
MMTNSLNLWIAQFFCYLRALPGGGNADEIETKWRTYDSFDKPVVTVYGSYDSGKSSLLKRLLVDDGKEVPDWLTVSARRETFDIHETEAFGCLLRDTPGISGGNASHEAITYGALALSDSFLVVLTPQLLTADREQIVQFLSGKFFNISLINPFVQGSLKLVVARMDEAGADPSEDEDNYRNLVQRKQDELQQILKGNGIDVTPSCIHVVMADPYGQVGNTKQPSASDYNELRHIDGIDSLAETLRTFPTALPALRRKAAVRYFSWVGSQSLQVIESTKIIRESALEECRNWVERIELLETELDALVDAATSDMEGTVEEVLTSVSRFGAATVEELIELIQPRLENALERWSQRHDVALNRLIQEAESELKQRATRPSAERLFDILGNQSEEDETTGTDRDRWILGLRQLGNLLNQGLQAYCEIQMGMTSEQAALELEKLYQFDGVRKYIKVLPGGKKLSGMEQVEHLQKQLGFKRALETVGPVLLEMGELVVNHIQEQQLAHQKVQHRAKLREKIAISARDIAIDALDEWKDRVDGFRRWLEEKKEAYFRHEKGLHEEVELLNKKMNELNKLFNDLQSQKV